MDTIDVFALARHAAQWEGRRRLAAMARLCPSLTDGPGERDAELRFACRSGTDGHGRPALQLLLEGVLPLRCDRCAQLLPYALHAQRQFYFVATEEELAAIPIDDTPEEALLGSAHFDLAGLIEDEAILQLPISPRHARCPGGAARTRRAAPPADAGRPHPFAALAGLRERLIPGAAPSGAPETDDGGTDSAPKVEAKGGGKALAGRKRPKSA